MAIDARMDMITTVTMSSIKENPLEACRPGLLGFVTFLFLIVILAQPRSCESR